MSRTLIIRIPLSDTENDESNEQLAMAAQGFLESAPPSSMSNRNIDTVTGLIAEGLAYYDIMTDESSDFSVEIEEVG